MANTRAEMNRLGNTDLPLVLEAAFMNLRDLEIQTSQILIFSHYLLFIVS